MSPPRALTVVIPVFNEGRWITSTLQDLARAARRAPALQIDVVVVDDGSTDDTAEAASSSACGLPLKLIRQANAGRHLARRRGLEDATGELVLFLDSRVSIAPDSLAFIAGRLAADGRDAVWNAHVLIETKGNPYGQFWNVLTELAFREYFSEPRTTSFDAESFDGFPKGTTCFLAPRELLRAAIDAHTSFYADARYGNDDLLMIRRIAEAHPIGISPEFACVYHPRERLRPFLRHAFHRGTVFLDGHGRRGSRLLPVIVGFYPVSAALALAAIRRPWLAPVSFAVVAAGAGAVAVATGRSPNEAAAFAALAPVYSVAHGLGMWRGLLLALRTTLARRQ